MKSGTHRFSSVKVKENGLEEEPFGLTGTRHLGFTLLTVKMFLCGSLAEGLGARLGH